VSAAHSEADIQATIEAAGKVFGSLWRRKLETVITEAKN
jgi:hypothetical protein